MKTPTNQDGHQADAYHAVRQLQGAVLDGPLRHNLNTPPPFDAPPYYRTKSSNRVRFRDVTLRVQDVDTVTRARRTIVHLVRVYGLKVTGCASQPPEAWKLQTPRNSNQSLGDQP